MSLSMGNVAIDIPLMSNVGGENEGIKGVFIQTENGFNKSVKFNPKHTIHVICLIKKE